MTLSNYEYNLRYGNKIPFRTFQLPLNPRQTQNEPITTLWKYYSQKNKVFIGPLTSDEPIEIAKANKARMNRRNFSLAINRKAR